MRGDPAHCDKFKGGHIGDTPSLEWNPERIGKLRKETHRFGFDQRKRFFTKATVRITTTTAVQSLSSGAELLAAKRAATQAEDLYPSTALPGVGILRLRFRPRSRTKIAGMTTISATGVTARSRDQ